MRVIERTKGEIRSVAIQLLTLQGNSVWINNNIAIKGRKFIGRKGVADIVGFNKRDGRYVAAEVKSLNDRLSKEQIEFLDDIKKAGGLCFIACQVENNIELKEW